MEKIIVLGPTWVDIETLRIAVRSALTAANIDPDEVVISTAGPSMNEPPMLVVDSVYEAPEPETKRERRQARKPQDVTGIFDRSKRRTH